MTAASDKRFLILAASYPSREYKSGADSHEIASAVKALIGAAFHQGWRIIFGGHPTISPLILMIAREYGQRRSVLIYQSNYFAGHLGQATMDLTREEFGEIVVVPNDPIEVPPGPLEIPDPTECPRSLLAMRRAMFSRSDIGGLILIGGDSGLREEFDLFRVMLPGQPTVPIGFPGGAASELLDWAQLQDMEPKLRAALKGSRNYTYLCAQIIRYVSTRFSRGPL